MPSVEQAQSLARRLRVYCFDSVNRLTRHTNRITCITPCESYCNAVDISNKVKEILVSLKTCAYKSSCKFASNTERWLKYY